MAKAGEFVSRNAKAVTSALGGILSVGTAAAGLIALVPDNMRPAAGAIAGFLALLEVLRTVNVWVVKNGPAIAKAADEVEEIVDDVLDVFRGHHDTAPATPAPAQAPAPVDTAGKHRLDEAPATALPGPA